MVSDVTERRIGSSHMACQMFKTSRVNHVGKGVLSKTE